MFTAVNEMQKHFVRLATLIYSVRYIGASIWFQPIPLWIRTLGPQMSQCRSERPGGWDFRQCQLHAVGNSLQKNPSRVLLVGESKSWPTAEMQLWVYCWKSEDKSSSSSPRRSLCYWVWKGWKASNLFNLIILDSPVRNWLGKLI